MSSPCILLGCIEEPAMNYVADPFFYQRNNDAAVKAIPKDDAYPPLCREMFSITGDDSAHGSFRGERLIFFAGQCNWFHSELPQWLDKFEALLRKLFWIHADVYVQGVGGPQLALKYMITQGTAEQYHVHPPRLPIEWTLHAYRLNTWEKTTEDLSPWVGEGRVLSPYE